MIFAVRHTQSVANADGSLYLKIPNVEITLSAKGEEHAEVVAKELADKLDLSADTTVYCSPFHRTLQTADRVTAELQDRGIPFFYEESPLLSEREWGTEWRKLIRQRGFLEEDFRFYAKPGGAESFAELYTRVKLFFFDLKTKHNADDNIVLVTHGEWIKIATMIANKFSVSAFELTQRNKVKNGQILTFDYQQL
jgi:broad specificity phosphatase PhoE